MTREAMIREARERRAAGQRNVRIAADLGVSASTVANWVNGGSCMDCGGPTDGSGGRGRERCAECNWRHRHESATWTPQRLIAEAKRWHELTGAWPVSSHWHTTAGSSAAAEYRRAVLEFRDLTGPWPDHATPCWAFGSWSAFIDACGGSAPGTRKGIRRGQRAAEMRAAIDRLKAQDNTTDLERLRAVEA